MSDDRDFYADADYDLDACEPPPRVTPSDFLERQKRLKREWAAIVERDAPDEDDTPGWPIRDEPLPADEQAADQKKETKDE